MSFTMTHPSPVPAGISPAAVLESMDGTEREDTRVCMSEAPLLAGAGAHVLAQTVVVIGVPSPMLLHGLESLLRQTSGIRLGGSADSMPALLANCARAGDGVALVDPSLGQMSIQDFMNALKSTSPHMHVVLMTDTRQPHQVREAVRHGASGLVAKTADAEEIQSAILAAAKGRRYISPAIAGYLAESLTLEVLTQREMDVLGLLSQGHCNKTIARSLDVTVGTVKTHVRAIMLKLGALSRTEAVRNAHRWGLVSFD
ncbi:MAG: hypothetical protein JWQ73_1795 [Variovorax sp.]|nr:hypothetical protein [Variovorax sp.]